jgi:fructokinase
LPAPSVEEVSGAPPCYCGKRGCLEVWCSGPGLAADFQRVTGRSASAEEIAASDGADERAAMARLIDRFARAMATMANILDPDVIVMGGGLSNVERLYRDLPPLVEKYGFNLGGPPKIVKNLHGDSSGVRGAAWLWPA